MPTKTDVVLAHFRWQPAIPSVLAFFVLVQVPTLLGAAPNACDNALWFWLPIAGIVISCGLAVAAGFCSLFPQAAWLLLAMWMLNFVNRGLLAEANRYVIYAGIGIALAAFALQLWRVLTKRFVPTYTES